MQIHNCDVLVIGSGSAGLQAALSAAEAGVTVIIAEKGLAGRSGSTVGAQQLCGVGRWALPGDSVEMHFQDSLKGGQYLNDQGLLRAIVAEAGQRIEDVMARGLNFDQDGAGRFVLANVAGHTYARSLAKGDSTGRHLADLLRSACSKADVRVLQDHFVLRLTEDGSSISGCIMVDLVAGELAAVSAGAVVLATGGAGQLYPLTTNPIQATGDGYSLALQAGATLCDMEMFQFYPVCLVAPRGLRGVPVGLSEYGLLRNAQGERFMERYDPERKERATRDKLSFGIYSEIRAGRGSANGGVYLDVTGHPDEVYRLFDWEYKQCLSYGLDLKHQMAEICPGAHYYMGGVRTDGDGWTGISRLFACGEVTGGAHGANRLGNNSVADCLVMGDHAGRAAAARSRGAGSGVNEAHIRDQETLLRRLMARPANGLNAFVLLDRLQSVMWRHFGLIRNRADLETGMVELAAIRSDLARTPIHTQTLVANQELQQYLEVKNMLMVAQCLGTGALARTESRGAHVRDDYPDRNAAWLRHITVRLAGEELLLGSAPVDASVVALPAG